MFRIISQRKLNELIRRKERDAFLRAYVLGYRQAEADKVGKGVIVGSLVDRELEKILRDKNWL